MRFPSGAESSLCALLVHRVRVCAYNLFYPLCNRITKDASFRDLFGEARLRLFFNSGQSCYTGPAAGDGTCKPVRNEKTCTILYNEDSMYRNTKNVPYYIFGKGALAQLPDLLAPRYAAGDGPVVYFVDHFFRDRDLIERLPLRPEDQLHFVDTGHEPRVEDADALTALVRSTDKRLPVCVLGVGGGATLDTAKAVANLLSNPGKAEDYQGWDLVKHPAPYKIGIPTLSGTGAECSRTCVLLNEPKKLKLGMNSDYTVYDQLLLDPELLRTVPRNQYFYTGIDTYMHCIETLHGRFRDAIVDALSIRAIEMCREIFLSDDMLDENNREKMMIASYLGGMAAGNVGVVHPLSAGLGVTLHIPHGLANCLALNVLEDIYPEQHRLFRTMLERQGVELPSGLCRDLSDEQYDDLYKGSIIHEKPLANALGPDFASVLTKENLIARFKRM